AGRPFGAAEPPDARSGVPAAVGVAQCIRARWVAGAARPAAARAGPAGPPVEPPAEPAGAAAGRGGEPARPGGPLVVYGPHAPACTLEAAPGLRGQAPGGLGPLPVDGPAVGAGAACGLADRRSCAARWSAVPDAVGAVLCPLGAAEGPEGATPVPGRARSAGRSGCRPAAWSARQRHPTPRGQPSGRERRRDTRRAARTLPAERHPPPHATTQRIPEAVPAAATGTAQPERGRQLARGAALGRPPAQVAVPAARGSRGPAGDEQAGEPKPLPHRPAAEHERRQDSDDELPRRDAVILWGVVPGGHLLAAGSLVSLMIDLVVVLGGCLNFGVLLLHLGHDRPPSSKR